jgi:hypothetical protein
MTHEDAITYIAGHATYPKSLKIIRLYALAMLNYRQPTGDRAWDHIRQLTDPETTSALAYLTGAASMGDGDWSHLVPELHSNAL